MRNLLDSILENERVSSGIFKLWVCLMVLDVASIPCFIISAIALILGCTRSEYAHVTNVTMSSVSRCSIRTTINGGVSLNLEHNDLTVCEALREGHSDRILVWINPWWPRVCPPQIELHDSGTTTDYSPFLKGMIFVIFGLWSLSALVSVALDCLRKRRIARDRIRVGAVKKDLEPV